MPADVAGNPAAVKTHPKLLVALPSAAHLGATKNPIQRCAPLFVARAIPMPPSVVKQSRVRLPVRQIVVTLIQHQQARPPPPDQSVHVSLSIRQRRSPKSRIQRPKPWK
ncbi:MAG: hypothetical protein ACKV19_22340 [Verrucomicrobiales bacterium]